MYFGGSHTPKRLDEILLSFEMTEYGYSCGRVQPSSIYKIISLLENSYAYAHANDKNTEHPVNRRVAEFHPNVWEYDFLQSLSSPYEAPSYCERVDTLIEEIKMDIFDGLVGDGEMNPSPRDLLEKLFIFDILQRLGIDRHFQKEIKAVLDYTYK
ncbi:hypothetical protein SUGI_0795040 [Cryptomeria japonica]|nr:hypothetical protein SUGI_0795040 [Cryptomeria japonica]